MGVSTAMRRASSRRRSADETLVHAKRMAPTAGISGVEELSPQNEFGVSVFAAMRPRSLSDGLTFGKGRTPVDAEVGALMEGLEFYFAEPGVSDVKTLWATARELAGQQAGGSPQSIHTAPRQNVGGRGPAAVGPCPRS